jgi:PAS domain S-box-containing protein/diguanylate cyclase (GGDEF)-like protein
MNRSIRVLHVEDDSRDAELIRQKLQADGLDCDIVWVDRRQAFETALAHEAFDLVIADYNLPDYDALLALAHVREKWPELPVIVVSGTVGEEEAVECLKAGATDYVLKQRPQRLGAAVTRALREAEQRHERRETQAALRQSEERFRAAFEQAAVGMALRDIDPRKPRWLRVNQKFCGILGYTQEELLQLTSVDLTPPDERDLAIDYNEKMLGGEIASYSREKRYVRKDGSIIWVNLSVTAVRGPNGSPTHVISVIQDITDHKAAADKIRRLNRVYAVLSGINALIVRVHDRRELLNEVCRVAVEHGSFGIAWIGTYEPAAQDVTPVAWAGRDAEAVAKSTSSVRAGTPQREGVTGRAITQKQAVFNNDIAAEPEFGSQRRREAIRLGYRSVIGLPLVVDGEAIGVLTLYATEANFFDEEELKLLKELASDISFALDHIAKEERLRYLAYYDALTGLPNGTLFQDRLTSLLRTAQQTRSRVAVMLWNVNRFRYINDTFGRHVGDAMLREVGRRLKQVSPDPEVVARISADEFASVLTDVKDASEIAHLLGKLVAEAFGVPVTIEGQELGVAVTAGIALFPDDGDDAERLYSNAETAVKQAKEAGEHYLFYRPAMNASVAETLSLERKMRKALEAEQFVLHYQPKIDLASGRISGLEALIRWNDPGSGLVPPVKFIPLLEETGMIVEVGHWAMRRALADYCAWRARGLPAPRIAVNVSAIQLRRKEFADLVRAAISESAAEPHGLDLEITESLLMDDIEGNIATLRMLRDMGIVIAIDDFGTGYSSLGYLAKLPVNALKIDRSFISTMAENPDSMTIVSTIISLAHALNLKVIAEGVETEEQSRFLRLLKCDEIQGYLVSKPVAADDAVALFAGFERRWK